METLGNIQEKQLTQEEKSKVHTELLHTELSRLKTIVRQNFAFYLTGLLVVFGMKLFYSRADCGQLAWILAPTAKWVTVLSGIPFVYEQDMGYVNHSLRLLIAPSCSGVQFMLILMATLIFSFVHRMGGMGGMDGLDGMGSSGSMGGLDGMGSSDSMDGLSGMGSSDSMDGLSGMGSSDSMDSLDGMGSSGSMGGLGGMNSSGGMGSMDGLSDMGSLDGMGTRDGGLQEKPTSRMKRGFAWTAASIGVSYLLTVFVNGLRIILAIYIPLLLADWNIYFRFLTPGRLHTIIGTVVYFVSLLTIYRLAGYVSLQICHYENNTPPERNAGTEQSTNPGQSTSAGSSGCRFAKLPAQTSLLRKCAPPVFWYFFMVLGVPFLNRAYQKGTERFTEYAVLVISVCSVILLPFCLGSLARKLAHKRKA